MSTTSNCMSLALFLNVSYHPPMAKDEKSGSLRERKKARTRRELITVASRLFRKQGYEATTLEQIADEAEVSIRTLLRYFESKLHLALAGHYDRLERLCARVEDPDRELDTLSCWREHVEESARAWTDTRNFAIHAKFVYRAPILLAGLLEIKFTRNDRQYRPLIYRGPGRSEATFLIGAFEQGDAFSPRNAVVVAQSRKTIVEKDNTRTYLHDYI